MNDESEHVPDQEARGIFSFAGLSSHGMNPATIYFISCLLFLSLVSKLALRLFVVNSYKCGMNERIVWLVLVGMGRFATTASVLGHSGPDGQWP